jgi:RNA polymerase sigma factor (sigma-70 family)
MSVVSAPAVLYSRGNNPAAIRIRSSGGFPLSAPARFASLVLPHLDAGYNLARWLLNDSHDARDATQEACVRALRSIANVRGDEARPWFLTIVRHACYDWIHRNPRPGLEAAESDDLVDPGADPEQAAIGKAESGALAAAIAALPLSYREVIVLRELEAMTYLEIAHVAGIPIGTVMSRLARARRLLRRSPLLEAVGATRAGAES